MECKNSMSNPCSLVQRSFKTNDAECKKKLILYATCGLSIKPQLIWNKYLSNAFQQIEYLYSISGKLYNYVNEPTYNQLYGCHIILRGCKV